MDKQQAKQRAKALVARMSIEEKMSQLLYQSPAIERLGIKEYNWWNEASHGVARAGTATVFPHAIAMAASFYPEIIFKAAQVVSTEARAKYNKNVEYGDRDIYKGLTFWTPNINIFRDPRWGRGQETYGEDPFLTATMACKYVNGLQGDGEFLKSAACVKHLAAHSGPERLRHGFNAVVSEYDLWQTYLPAFQWTIEHTDVAGVMGAYNRTNGVPCCCSERLLREILKEQWHFDGYIVSDCGALRDISEGHHYADSDVEAAALALNSGCTLNCGWAFERLLDAYEMDLITEETVTAAAETVFTTRFLLGEFEKDRPYRDIPYQQVDCPAHQALNLEVARQSIVLLKNEADFLPMDAGKKQTIAVIGPNGQSVLALEGNYNGYASRYVTVADGIREVFKQADVLVSKGCNLWFEKKNEWNGFGYMHTDGVSAAASADVTILCLGLDASIEGEDGCVSEGYTDGGDKRDLYLPETQQKLAEAVCDVCENVVVVLMSGGALDLGTKVSNHAKAILQAWYPGALGGLAVAQTLSGDNCPSGRLPITFYRGDTKLPDFSDYDMSGRTYRYLTEEPNYPFGFGLSYTKFAYSGFSCSRTENGALVSVSVTNTGKRNGTEKVQIYAKLHDSRTKTANCQLCAIAPVELAPGETKEIRLTVDPFWLNAVLPDGTRTEPDGGITLFAGGHQPDKRSDALCGYACLQETLK
ncbi:MAG: glycoside hydrolase family 3 C-terminal domain-containing protein [Oscillospiraceae bacterium]|nr:glycoside hydrolase family 3 C-terminal domain-containing protein [Oscillospiraceae bacterium]